jgi:hypothetical protein
VDLRPKTAKASDDEGTVRGTEAAARESPAKVADQVDDASIDARRLSLRLLDHLDRRQCRFV